VSFIESHDHSEFGGKTISYFAGVALLINNITGPGVRDNIPPRICSFSATFLLGNGPDRAIAPEEGLRCDLTPSPGRFGVVKPNEI
jgi:hypothetical protein